MLLEGNRLISIFPRGARKEKGVAMDECIHFDPLWTESGPLDHLIKSISW
jgi:hypothetical protein